MTNIGGGALLKIKRNLVSGNAPTTAQLDAGELAVNVADGNLFVKKVAAGNESIQKFIPDSVASTIYAPIASPTFTGEITAPNAVITGKVKYTAVPSANYGISGDVISLIANIASVFGDAVFISSLGKAKLCDASEIGKCPYCIAICADSSVPAGASGSWMTKGSLRNNSWSFTVGGLIYVKVGGTSGATLTQTVASGSGNVIMPVAVALSATTIYFFGNINSVEQQ